MDPRADRIRQFFRGDRAVSHVIGFALLLGLVLMGSILVLVLGMGMLDSIEADSEAEITYAAVDSTEHGIQTTLETGQSQSVSADDYVAGGQVELVWFGDDPYTNESVTLPNLGALEYEVEGKKIVHQSGGTWEVSDSHHRTTTPPDIGYENGGIQVRFTEISREGTSSSGSTVSVNESSEYPELIGETERTAVDDNEYTNMSFTITSGYHELWYDYLHSEFDPDNDDDIEVESDGNEVTVTIENAYELETRGNFVVTDITLPEGNGLNVGEGETLPVEVEVENKGEEIASTDLNFTVDSEEHRSERITLEPDETETLEFSIDTDEYGMTAEESYEFEIDTEDHVVSEEFTVRYPHTYFEIHNIELDPADIDEGDAPSSDADWYPINLTIENRGIEDGNQSIGLEMDWEGDEGEVDVDPHVAIDQEESGLDIHRNFKETGETTIWINGSSILAGDYTVRFSTANDTREDYLSLEEGGMDPSDGSVTVDADKVTMSVMGTEASRVWSGAECNSGNCWKGWIPITSSVLVDGAEKYQWKDQNGENIVSENLNTKHYWDHTWSYTWDIPSGEEQQVTVEATTWECNDWEQVGTTPASGGGTWADLECAELGDDDITVNPAEAGDESNLVILEDGDEIKNVDQPGADQMSVGEILGDKIDEETGELQLTNNLSKNQVVFLAEVTHENADWDDVDPDDPGDPNFNDVIILLETENEIPDTLGKEVIRGADSGNSEFSEPEIADPGDPPREAVNDGTIDVRSGHVVIS
ncbi:DUF7289 family protein [Natrarchaeobius chitinivorans]|nr:hypothetical protein [Natrarchaeobius chitinivorans]